MKILQIEVTNYRLIKALLLDLDGENMAVAGKPGQGKTTAISLLWESLKVVGDPITHGEKKGQIKITLGDGKTKAFVTRSLTARTSPISVVTSEGDTVSAKEFANWFCDLGNNPHKIMSMKPSEQTKALLEAVKLPDGVDLDDLDVRRAESALQRLDLKRDGERALKSLGEEPEKIDRVDISELVNQQTIASAANEKHVKISADIEGAEQVLKNLGNQRSEKHVELKQAEQAAKKAEEDYSAQIDKITKLKSDAEELPAVIDTNEIQREIVCGNEANAKASTWDAWNEKNDSLHKLRSEYSAKNDEVKALDKSKKEALEAAIWPLDGLSIEDGSILFNGSQLAQCGHSEQMLVCGALAAETITNHKLHVVRMDGVESMSQEDFKRLEQIFNDKGIQVLSSRVTRGDIDDGELLIVDGEIDEK